MFHHWMTQFKACFSIERCKIHHTFSACNSNFCQGSARFLQLACSRGLITFQHQTQNQFSCFNVKLISIMVQYQIQNHNSVSKNVSYYSLKPIFFTLLSLTHGTIFSHVSVSSFLLLIIFQHLSKLPISMKHISAIFNHISAANSKFLSCFSIEFIITMLYNCYQVSASN